MLFTYFTLRLAKCSSFETTTSIVLKVQFHPRGSFCLTYRIKTILSFPSELITMGCCCHAYNDRAGFTHYRTYLFDVFKMDKYQIFNLFFSLSLILSAHLKFSKIWYMAGMKTWVSTCLILSLSPAPSSIVAT